jgi:GntR family transcriptional regulator, transcriptional repressor for pyruvate dehydrogenase complex
MKAETLDTQLAQQVINHIRAKIEDGTLQPGDKIPPEREFAKALNISRASLRTGIGYLAAIGVMKVRHGVGTFIADGPAEFGKASIGLLGALFMDSSPGKCSRPANCLKPTWLRWPPNAEMRNT